MADYGKSYTRAHFHQVPIMGSMVSKWKLWTRQQESSATDSSLDDGDEAKREERNTEFYAAAFSTIGFVVVWLGVIYGWA